MCTCDKRMHGRTNWGYFIISCPRSFGVREIIKRYLFVPRKDTVQQSLNSSYKALAFHTLLATNVPSACGIHLSLQPEVSKLIADSVIKMRALLLQPILRHIKPESLTYLLKDIVSTVVSHFYHIEK